MCFAFKYSVLRALAPRDFEVCVCSWLLANKELILLIGLISVFVYIFIVWIITKKYYPVKKMHFFKAGTNLTLKIKHWCLYCPTFIAVL